MLLALLAAGRAQVGRPPRIHKILIRNVGPPAVSDDFIRANIRAKVGEPFPRPVVDEDIKNLYATGYFYKIQVGRGEHAGRAGFDLRRAGQTDPDGHQDRRATRR